MRKGIIYYLLRQKVVCIIIVVIFIGVIISVNPPDVSLYFNLNPLSRTASIMTLVVSSQLFIISVNHFNLSLRSTELFYGLSANLLLKGTLINYFFGQRARWLQIDRCIFMNSRPFLRWVWFNA